jgi:hypothetical protein
MQVLELYLVLETNSNYPDSDALVPSNSPRQLSSIIGGPSLLALMMEDAKIYETSVNCMAQQPRTFILAAVRTSNFISLVYLKILYLFR